MTERSILILGANGRLGRAAADAFAAAGWRVLAQVRRDRPAQPAVTPTRTPLADTDALAREAAGVDVVLYAINPPYTAWECEALPSVRLGMDVAQRLAATFMLPGNVYNYGAQMPPLLRIDTPQRPTEHKGAIRHAIEAEMARRADSGLRSIVLRAGDFYGSGKGTWLDLAITKSITRGRLAYPGPLDRNHAWAYVPDLARAFVAVAERAPIDGFTRLHFAGHTATGTELLTAIEAAAADIGLAAPAGGWRHTTMPWRLMRAGGIVVPMWRELAQMEYLWRVPHALDGSALRAAVGALPDTTPRTALRQSLMALGHGRNAAARHARTT